jgi:hypothetical protein
MLGLDVPSLLYLVGVVALAVGFWLLNRKFGSS